MPPESRRVLGGLLIAALFGRAANAQTTPQQPVSGPTVTLDKLDDAPGLERYLRELITGKAELQVTVPGGTAHVGGFAVGTRDTLHGHLLVLRGPADVYGRLEGNVVSLDGDIVVHRGGSVAGDALALGGTVRHADGSVTGQVRSLGSRPTEAKGSTPLTLTLAQRAAGLLGVFLTLVLLGFGLVTFGRPSLETVSDTVMHSLSRSFAVGLLAQILVIPTLGLLVLGLALTVVGLGLIPFTLVAGTLLILVALLLGILAVAHAMGETWTRRRMARGVMTAANSYRYVLQGLLGVLAVWIVWTLFGWVPVAGMLVFAGAGLATWLLATVGFGASILSRAGVRDEFAGRYLASESLTDEYLWATPQKGVPAVKRPTQKG